MKYTSIYQHIMQVFNKCTGVAFWAYGHPYGEELISVYLSLMCLPLLLSILEKEEGERADGENGTQLAFQLITIIYSLFGKFQIGVCPRYTWICQELNPRPSACSAQLCYQAMAPLLQTFEK